MQNQLGFTDSNGKIPVFVVLEENNGVNTSLSRLIPISMSGRQDETFRAGGDVLYSHTDQIHAGVRNDSIYFPNLGVIHSIRSTPRTTTTCMATSVV